MLSSLLDFLGSIDDVGVAGDKQIRGKNIKRLALSDHFTLSLQQLLGYTASKLVGKRMPQAVLVSAREGADKQDKVLRPKVPPQERRVMEWFLDGTVNDGSLRWDELLGGVSVIRADGNHFSIMMPHAVSVRFLNPHEWFSY